MSNVLGVGIDLVSINEIKELDKRLSGSFVQRTFTSQEQNDAEGASDYYQFLAGRFAVKEAVYKAICGNYIEVNFDFRQVETIRLSNGAPQFRPTASLVGILNTIGACDIKISISNQGDFAIAIAEVVSA